MSFLQEEAIKRGLRGVERKDKLPETFSEGFKQIKNEIKWLKK